MASDAEEGTLANLLRNFLSIFFALLLVAVPYWFLNTARKREPFVELLAFMVRAFEVWFLRSGSGLG